MKTVKNGLSYNIHVHEVKESTQSDIKTLYVEEQTYLCASDFLILLKKAAKKAPSIEIDLLCRVLLELMDGCIDEH